MKLEDPIAIRMDRISIRTETKQDMVTITEETLEMETFAEGRTVKVTPVAFEKNTTIIFSNKKITKK